MKILLINPSVGYYTRALSNPLGLLSIGTYLKQHGHDVKIYDRCVDKTKIHKVFKEFSPQVIGVSVMSSRGVKDAIYVSKWFKRYNLPIIWGGQLPSMQSELVLDKDFVDFVSFGEGEETWKELVESYEKGQNPYEVAGLAYKNDGKIIYNECRNFSDLKDMPVSDWSLLDVPIYNEVDMVNEIFFRVDDVLKKRTTIIMNLFFLMMVRLTELVKQ